MPCRNGLMSLRICCTPWACQEQTSMPTLASRWKQYYELQTQSKELTREPPSLFSTFVYRGSLRRRTSTACPKFDMVWEGGNFIKWFLPAFATWIGWGGGSQRPVTANHFVWSQWNFIYSTVSQSNSFFFFYYGSARMINRTPLYTKKKNTIQFFLWVFVQINAIFFI